MSQKKTAKIPLPKCWPRHVRSAIVHVISLAQYATVDTPSWAVDSMNGRVRLKAENDQLHQELALQREEAGSRMYAWATFLLSGVPITPPSRECRSYNFVLHAGGPCGRRPTRS